MAQRGSDMDVCCEEMQGSDRLTPWGRASSTPLCAQRENTRHALRRHRCLTASHREPNVIAGCRSNNKRGPREPQRCNQAAKPPQIAHCRWLFSPQPPARPSRRGTTLASTSCQRLRPHSGTISRAAPSFFCSTFGLTYRFPRAWPHRRLIQFLTWAFAFATVP